VRGALGLCRGASTRRGTLGVNTQCVFTQAQCTGEAQRIGPAMRRIQPKAQNCSQFLQIATNSHGFARKIQDRVPQSLLIRRSAKWRLM